MLSPGASSDGRSPSSRTSGSEVYGAAPRKRINSRLKISGASRCGLCPTLGIGGAARKLSRVDPELARTWAAPRTSTALRLRDLGLQQGVEVQVDPELLRGALETVGQVYANQAVENASAEPGSVK